MNSGGVILKEVVKNLGSRKGSEEAQSLGQAFSETESRVSLKVGVTKRELKLVRKQQGVKERVFRLYPGLKPSHITKLFGFMSINERAIVDPEHDESFFSSYFHQRVIEKVELYDNAILIELASPQPSQSRSLNEMIELYGNRPESRFYEIGKILTDIFSVASGAKEEVGDEKRESVKKNLDSLGDSMFVCIFGVRKVAVSKALLAFLSYDFEELALEIVKFKTVSVEFFEANSYYTVLVHILEMFKHICKLSNNEISFSTFKQLTTLRYSDFIVSKDHVRSYCDMTISLISPSCLCHKINFVYYTAEEKWLRGRKPSSESTIAIDEEKDRVRQCEYQLLKRIKEVPDFLFRQNQKKTAGYRSLQKEEAQP